MNSPNIFSRRMYGIILLHILLILATAGTGLWLVISATGYIIGGLLLLCSLAQIAGLTRQLNAFNRKIRYFFDAIQDKDHMLCFPETNISKEQAQLNRALNRLNRQMAEMRMEAHKQEHFFRALLEEIPNGLLAWNVSGEVILSNSAANTLLDCPLIRHSHQVEQLLKERKNLSLSQKQIKLQEETLTLLSIKDIGNELRDKESESWSSLTHVLTHEIMNTIAPILSLSQTLSTHPGTHDKTARGLEIIRTQSERLLEFTESFRRLSYLPPPEKRLFSVTRLLDNLEELLQSDFSERGIRFVLECSPAAIELEGDEKQLSQVFLNLLRNAMQALEDTENGIIYIKIEKEDKNLLFLIEDNGSGISTEIKDKVFIPFFTTKPEGTGIGLCLCRQIIRHHNGQLIIKESHPGKTVFEINIITNPNL